MENRYRGPDALFIWSLSCHKYLKSLGFVGGSWLHLFLVEKQNWRHVKIQLKIFYRAEGSIFSFSHFSEEARAQDGQLT